MVLNDNVQKLLRLNWYITNLFGSSDYILTLYGEFSAYVELEEVTGEILNSLHILTFL